MTSGEDPTSHNIPVGEDATPAAKRDQPRWLKSRFPGRSSEGERLEFLSFDEGVLEGDGITHEAMDIEDDEGEIILG